MERASSLWGNNRCRSDLYIILLGSQTQTHWWNYRSKLDSEQGVLRKSKCSEQTVQHTRMKELEQQYP